jgi:hypothetical protein
MIEPGQLHDFGVFLRREAIAVGYTDRDLTIAVRRGIVTRVRHGAYVASATWAAADVEQRHRIRTVAVVLTHGDRVALSHTTAAVHHGLRLWNANLERIHVLRLDGGPSRVCGDIVYHAAGWGPDDICESRGLLVTSPARAAVEAASLHAVESGLVILDSAIDLRVATPQELAGVFESMTGWPRSQRLQVAIRLMRPGAQSVGETRTRHLCWVHGLPEPELQYEVHDSRGVLIGTTDFAWPEHGLLGEFDGRVKYGRLLKPGEEPGDVVFREKCREDALREVTDYRMVRFIWVDLDVARATAARIRSALGLRAA